MAVSKFMVHGGRRWRELELDTGRVSGWGAVNFVCVQRGKLELVPRPRVLRALRALVARAPGRCAAKLGPRLSQKRYLRNERKSKDRRESETVGRQKDLTVHTCCQHHSHCSTDANFNSILKPSTSSVAVQCRPLVTTGVQATSTSETDGIRSINAESQTNKSQSNRREELRNGDHGGDEEWEITSRSRNKLQLVKKKQSQECQSSDSHVGLEAEKGNESERERVNRNEPIEVQVKEVRRSQSRESSRESERRDLRKKKLQSNKDLRRKKKKTKKEEQEQEICKELVITEDEVTWLRNFLVTDDTNVFGVDLEQFDSNNAYKEQLFYRLNPVVDLERCPRIARILRDRARQADSVSLEDFITTLGLRSVAGTSPTHSRYRMRARRKNDVTDARTRSSGDSGGDKENITAKPVTRDRSRNRQVDRVLEETNKKQENRSASSQQSKADTNHAKANLRNNSKHLNEVEEATAKGKGKGEKRKEDAPPPAKIAKRGVGGGMREYSADEDAYILRWVRGEGRARLVKGNRTWMQLQSFHKANTGVFRTWQSLRNRYLRYLLPSLGRLELPPQEASRLRAAAATGELKARNLPPRRNSLFQQPAVRSAWAQRPRAPLEQTAVASDAEDTTPSRALRSAQTTGHSSSKRTNTRAEITANSSLKRTNTRVQTTANSSLKRTNTRVQPTANNSPNRTNTRAQTTADSSPKRTNTRQQTTAPSPPRHTDKPFVRTPTYSEITKRFARRHRSTPNSDTVSHDATDTSSVTSVTTVSSDRRARQTRRSNKRVRSNSDSDRPSKLRRSSRHRDTSAQNVDKKDRHSENAIPNDRQTKERQRSISLDSETNSQQSYKRRSARRRDRSDQNVDKKDRHNENAIPNDRQTKERQRSISLDSDTDSQQLNKRRRSARRDQNVDKKDRHNENTANDKQTKNRQRSISLDSDTDSQQSNKSNSDQNDDSSEDTDTEDATEDSDTEPQQVNRRRRSARRRDRSVRHADNNDRRVGDSRKLADKSDSNKHQRASSEDSDTERRQVNRRRRNVRQNDDNTYRQIEKIADNGSGTSSPGSEIEVPLSIRSKQSDASVGKRARRSRSVAKIDRQFERGGQKDVLDRQRGKRAQRTDKTDRHRDKSAQRTDKTDRHERSGQNADVLDRQRNKSAQRTDKTDRHRDKSAQRTDKTDRHERSGQNADVFDRQRSKSAQRTDKTDRQRDKSVQRTDKTDRQSGSARDDVKNGSLRNRDKLDARGRQIEKSDTNNRTREKSAQDTDKNYRHRDRSARRGDNEMQSDERGRIADKTGRIADKTGRQPPRTRRLYNPNAM